MIAAAPIRVSYLAQVSPANPWTITVHAGGPTHFRRVDDSDLERLVARDAQPAVSQRDAQHGRADAGDGHGPSTSSSGDVTFRFVDSWNYTVGNYTQTVTFTLSSP